MKGPRSGGFTSVRGGGIPAGFEDLVTEPVVCLLATKARDGAVMLSPVWAEYADGTLTFSSRASTFKSRHLLEEPLFSVSLMDPTGDYRHLELRCRVLESTSDGAHEHFDRMAKRFWGVEQYPNHNYSIDRLLFEADVLLAVGFQLPFDPRELPR